MKKIGEKFIDCGTMNEKDWKTLLKDRFVLSFASLVYFSPQFLFLHLCVGDESCGVSYYFVSFVQKQ